MYIVYAEVVSLLRHRWVEYVVVVFVVSENLCWSYSESGNIFMNKFQQVLACLNR